MGRARAITAIAGAAAMLGVFPMTATAGFGDEHTYWGWVVVRNPSMSSYTPAAPDRGNSTGGGVQVHHLTTGRYEIKFDNLTASSYPRGGLAHVSPISSKPRICSVSNINATGSIDLIVAVDCFNQAGMPVDSQFSLSYLASGEQQGTLGYLRVLSPDQPNPNLDEFSSFNSANGAISLTRFAAGSYRAHFGDLQTAGGSVLVTTMYDDYACRAGQWNGLANEVTVDVRCYNSAGTLHDAYFMLTFMDGLGVKGFGGTSVAYLRATRPKTSSYTPPAAFRFSTESGTPNVKHLAKGKYRVRLPNFETGGAAVVTAVGDGKQRCQLEALPTAGSPKKIDVHCFTPGGGSTNSPFVLSFLQ